MHVNNYKIHITETYIRGYIHMYYSVYITDGC